MTKDFEELCDNIDAAVFTGDVLWDEDNRMMFREFLYRWGEELENTDQLANELEELKKFDALAKHLMY